METLSSFVERLTPATFGVTITTKTTPRMNKTGNPYIGRVQKITQIDNAALRYNYENVINARLERNGIEGTYKAEKPKGKTFDVPNLILHSDADPTQKYLRVTWNKRTSAKTQWVLDGQVINDSTIINDIQQYIPQSNENHCKKQMEYGLDAKDEVVVRDYKFESIQRVEQGQRVWESA